MRYHINLPLMIGGLTLALLVVGSSKAHAQYFQYQYRYRWAFSPNHAFYYRTYYRYRYFWPGFGDGYYNNLAMNPVFYPVYYPIPLVIPVPNAGPGQALPKPEAPPQAKAGPKKHAKGLPVPKLNPAPAVVPKPPQSPEEVAKQQERDAGRRLKLAKSLAEEAEEESKLGHQSNAQRLLHLARNHYQDIANTYPQTKAGIEAKRLIGVEK